MKNVTDVVNGAVTGVVNYTARTFNPASYATDATNQTWQDQLVQDTQKQPITILNTTTIQHNAKEHPYATDMGKRAADKTTAIIQTLVPACLNGNPSTQNPSTIETILDVNPWLIPDLHYLLALKALEEQKQIRLLPTPDAKVNVLLHKTKQLSKEQQAMLVTMVSQTLPVTAKSTLLVNALATLSEEELNTCVTLAKAKKEGQQPATASSTTLIPLAPQQPQ